VNNEEAKSIGSTYSSKLNHSCCYELTVIHPVIPSNALYSSVGLKTCDGGMEDLRDYLIADTIEKSLYLEPNNQHRTGNRLLTRPHMLSQYDKSSTVG
jgi:hypothetical protein